MIIEIEHIKKWLQLTTNKIEENKHHLTKLDQALGDGDHGINMARGFKAATVEVSDKEYETVADLCKAIAMIVMSKVGGAAGPLYGTGFLRLSLSLKGKEVVSYEDFVQGLKDGLQGIKQRGRAEKDEKTLIDVWEPVIEEMKQTKPAHPERIEKTAKEAMEMTANTMATKGRAAYFKEKSIGHIDPGAASSYYLFSSLAAVLKGGL